MRRIFKYIIPHDTLYGVSVHRINMPKGTLMEIDCVKEAREALKAFKTARLSYKKDECLRSLKASLEKSKGPDFRWDVWKCVFEGQPKGYRFLHLEEMRSEVNQSKKLTESTPSCLRMTGCLAYANFQNAYEIETGHSDYKGLLAETAAIWNEAFGHEPEYLAGLKGTNEIIAKYHPVTANEISLHFPKEPK